MASHTNYILEGEYSAIIYGKEVTLHQGQVLYIEPNKKHRPTLRKGQKVLMLDF